MVSARGLLQPSGRPFVVGHRGAAAERPENTLAAFEAGLDAGADAVECDVHLSADGEVVVIHDATLDRTTGLRGKVSETPFEALHAVGVPSLREVVEFVRNRTVLIVELKGGEGLEEKVVRLLQEAGTTDATVLFAFEPDRLARVKALDASLVTVLLGGDAAPIEGAAGVGADAVGLHYSALTEETAAATRTRSLPTFAWTVPPGPEVERLRALGVAALITDYPREIRARLNESSFWH